MRTKYKHAIKYVDVKTMQCFHSQAYTALTHPGLLSFDNPAHRLLHQQDLHRKAMERDEGV